MTVLSRVLNLFVPQGCYSILDGHDEIRFYPRESKLDNKFAKIVRVQSQVFVLDILDDQLVVFGADALVTIYELSILDKNTREFLIFKYGTIFCILSNIFLIFLF